MVLFQAGDAIVEPDEFFFVYFDYTEP